MLRANFPRRREQRHAEALLREADRSKRSNSEQLALIDQRRGNSTRERERIENGK